jgi:hypothetical protein
MKQSHLPEYLLYTPDEKVRKETGKTKRKNISDMKIGEKGYTYPWAMNVDENGLCWIKLSYPCLKEAGGTVHMRIQRVKGGFLVSLASIKRKEYTPLPLKSYNEYTPVQLVDWLP